MPKNAEATAAEPRFLSVNLDELSGKISDDRLRGGEADGVRWMAHRQASLTKKSCTGRMAY
jgi:hypothetical protein